MKNKMSNTKKKKVHKNKHGTQGGAWQKQKENWIEVQYRWG